MKSRTSSPIRGFTLAELMLSIAIFLLLMTAAFSLVSATSELMTEVSETQNSAAARMRFAEVCRTAFESATNNSTIEFHIEDRGSDRADTYLSLVNTPSAFDFGVNLQDEIDRVIIATEFRPDGTLRSGLYYMTALDYEEALQNGFQNVQAPYVELIPRMWQLTWRFYNSRTREWEGFLEDAGDPSLIEMTARIVGDPGPMRSVFFFIGDAGSGSTHFQRGAPPSPDEP